MSDLVVASENLPSENPNAPDRVKFRQSMLTLQEEFAQRFDQKEVKEKCTLAHFFTPIDPKYGCCAYARQIFLPKGSTVIGKIHRHQHLNFILKGKVSVNTEFGKQYFEAPCTFISEVGLKRAVYAEEDTIWTTVHLTQYSGEENLDKIEDEVIAKDYSELGLLSSVEQLQIGETK